MKENGKLGQKGQVFIEYILLLAVITLLASGLKRGVNGQIANMWLKIANIIAYPTKVTF